MTFFRPVLTDKMASSNVPFRNIVEAYQRIKPFVHQTPVLTCSTFNKLASKNSGCKDNSIKIELFFKCENLQKTGAFKARGASNAVMMAKGQRGQLRIFSVSNQLFVWTCRAQENPNQLYLNIVSACTLIAPSTY